MGLSPLLSSLPNTRDQLRGAHDLALVHDDRADHYAPIRLQPPLVSCIALFDSWFTPAGLPWRTGRAVCNPTTRHASEEW